MIRRFFKSPIKKRLAQYSKTHPRFRKCWKKILYTKRRIYYWWRGLGVTPDEKTEYLILLTEKRMDAVRKQCMSIC